MLVPVFAVCVNVTPLLIVTPVTGRCFYSAYVMMIIYSCELLMFIIHNFVHDKNVIKGLYVLVIIALCASCVFYAVKYTQIKHFEDERNSFIISQIESGNKTVYLPHFPKNLNLIQRELHRDCLGGMVFGKTGIRNFITLIMIFQFNRLAITHTATLLKPNDFM